MMKRFYSGQQVKAGTYLNFGSGEFASVPRGGGQLPGEAGSCYRKVPAMTMVVVGPFMGLIYVILLPLVGVVSVPLILFRLARRLTGEVGQALARAAVPGWVPGAAYLMRQAKPRQPTPTAKPTPAIKDTLTILETEVRKRRGQKKK